MLLSDLDKAALDLPAVPGPGLPAVELEDGAVLLHEGDEVVLHRVVQVRGLPEESDHEYRCSNASQCNEVSIFVSQSRYAGKL